MAVGEEYFALFGESFDFEGAICIGVLRGLRQRILVGFDQLHVGQQLGVIFDFEEHLVVDEGRAIFHQMLLFDYVSDGVFESLC